MTTAAVTAQLGQRIGHVFADEGLLRQALTHRSASRDNNERLEFLGDAVVNLVVAEALFDQFPDLEEGELSRLRAQLVRAATLTQHARRLGLGEWLALGEGESRSGGENRDSILADAMEAVFGAVLKDGGFAAARAVVHVVYADALAAIDPLRSCKDPKTRLQELLQKQALPIPVYRTVQVLGAAHRQRFVVECHVGGAGGIAERGEGGSRRQAEQEAASRVLARLEPV